jgi:excisionase family DNA binding protein
MSEDTDKLAYNIPEAAKALGVSKATIWRKAKSGQLHVFHFLGRALIRADEIRAYLHPPEPDIEPEWAQPKPPPMPRCGVYLLKQGERFSYVGRSVDLRSRLGQHRRSGRPFDSVEIIECAAEVAQWLEGELVRVLQPEQNIIRYQRRAAIAERQRKEAGIQ